jgi:hypothetical protein
MPQSGTTPLHMAAEEGHAAVVGALLAAKADKEAKDQVRGGGMQGESGAGRCGMGSRPMCGPGVFFLPEIDVDTLSHARLKTYWCCFYLKM